MRCLRVMMKKIKDFIKDLESFNPDAEITTPISETILLSYICKDEDGNDLTKENTPLVFIESADECPLCSHEYIEDNVRMCSFYQKPCKMVEECYAFEEFDER